MLVWAEAPAVAAELPTSIDGRFVQADRAAFVADLDRARDTSDAAERTRQTDVDAALVAAREQWLAQQWDELDTNLASIEQTHLALLAQPSRCEAGGRSAPVPASSRSWPSKWLRRSR